MLYQTKNIVLVRWHSARSFCSKFFTEKFFAVIAGFYHNFIFQKPIFSILFQLAAAPPECQHGVPCKVAVVKKSGPNTGRYFYTCAAPKKSRCKVTKLLHSFKDLFATSA